MVAQNALVDWIRCHPIKSFILGCLLPVHGILWPLLALGVDQGMLQPFKILFALLPTTMAFVITGLLAGENGIKTLWAKLFKKETPWWIYVLATLSFLFLALATIFIHYNWVGYLPGMEDFPLSWNSIPLLVFLLVFPGFTEEFGWRGFMQERLPGKWPVFISSFLVGLVWGAWHMMDFLMGNWPATFSVVALFFTYITGTSVVIGFIYKMGKGSVLVAILAHFSANITNFFTPVWDDAAGFIVPGIFIGLIWVVAIGLGLKEVMERF